MYAGGTTFVATMAEKLRLLKHLTLPFKANSLGYLGNTYPKMMEWNY
jgi:hypothetical protein